MTCVMQMITPPEVEGQYLKSFDFDAFGGRGFGEFTQSLEKAMRFKDVPAAMEFWRTASTVMPLRPDGKPNRPLTASTVSIENLPQEQ